MASDSNYYYVVLGTQLFYKVKGSDNDWQRIPTSSFASGVGGRGSDIKLATYNGVYPLNNLNIGDKIANSPQRAKVLSNGAIVGWEAPDSVGIVRVDGSGAYSGDVVGRSISGYVDYAGQNTSFKNADGKVTGADGDLITTSKYIGRDNNWSGSRISFSSATAVITADSLAIATIDGLIGTNGGGYYELYTADGKLQYRLPSTTVNEAVAYQVSELSKSIVTGFFRGDDNDFFVLTANKGLWYNRDGQWRWE